MKIIPLGDRVLVKPISPENKKTKSGIIIPDTIDKERPEQGEVVAAGPGKEVSGKLQKLSVKKGDKVIFSKYGYDEIKIDGEEFFILKEESILAVIS
ncbi:co-chaperone GroES [Candidatus Campbellbacteria bacterium CG11_big_fil_rev_8_21_14_0_20_44_21]|uniref:Co-chaperonin GroES n=1 Tax=Candidatus Campbellbacteria bacterium CG22_combo_CG10-13_8_21_14_all_43_18 TaxID=1974530 RepID=A0A2H0DVY1_9BACT|nr:MAG: co-chaperone GroES [Candidatus Campbellbacteria bacterium CG22_combo_CG10-13_8_21_14_all_43_18]PIR24277.1 MAG: co-chaperone GroES [Candidatus Campbellbacteria bacterium CG11_big_fil_rev_8_21_14_0_20_44_21]